MTNTHVLGFDKSKVELLYAHLDNNVDQAVYCIVVDHVWKSVVLCIRGSLSLEDYVINLQVDPEKLDAVGVDHGFDGDGEYCHKGYLVRAQWLCKDLKSHGILDHVLNKETGYALRVSGHSLGAGTAAPVAGECLLYPSFWLGRVMMCSFFHFYFRVLCDSFFARISHNSPLQ